MSTDALAEIEAALAAGPLKYSHVYHHTAVARWVLEREAGLREANDQWITNYHHDATTMRAENTALKQRLADMEANTVEALALVEANEQIAALKADLARVRGEVELLRDIEPQARADCASTLHREFALLDAYRQGQARGEGEKA
jgi:hypothetical protein